jgi:light-regulated signal transduction histidine kinase (bacteriophytochrome)
MARGGNQLLTNQLIDNSLGAKATSIKIYFLDELNENKNVILFVDNGIGMNEEELDRCYILHNRDKASDERAGYFGIGSKHAKIHFTQHKYKSKTISKKSNTQLMEIDANWLLAVNKNEYNPKSHEITISGNKIWEKYHIIR